MTDERYMKPGLNHAVGKVIEEIAELQIELNKLSVALGKTMRHGWHSYDPTVAPQERLLNHEWVRMLIAESYWDAEMADVQDAIERLRGEMIKADLDKNSPRLDIKVG